MDISQIHLKASEVSMSFIIGECRECSPFHVERLYVVGKFDELTMVQENEAEHL